MAATTTERTPMRFKKLCAAFTWTLLAAGWVGLVVFMLAASP